MSWATNYIAKLLAGETVQFRPHGHSMSGKIDNGDLVTVEPVTDPTTLTVGEIVLCKVRRVAYLHLIKAKRGDRQFQIGNNRGGINGWTSANKIFGRVVAIGETDVAVSDRESPQP